MSMRKIAYLYLSICAILFGIIQVFAQIPATHAGKGSVAAVAYTGPGDVIGANWKAWWGFRAFSAADLANKLANICDSTGGVDVTCVDMFSSGATGALVVTAPGGVACVANCTIKTLYDRIGAANCSGACDITQPTVANRPVLLPSCINGFACMTCVKASTQGLQTAANSATQAQPLTVTQIAQRTGSTSSFNAVWATDSGGIQLGFTNSTNTALIFAGSVVSVGSVNDNVFHAMSAAINGAATIYNIDSATGTVSPGSGTVGAETIGLCAPTNAFDGKVLEAGMLSGALTAGNLVSLNTNYHAAYGGF